MQEEIAKTLANVFVGDDKEPIGAITMLRGKFVFTPGWNAGPNIPARFPTDTSEEMKIALSEKGLRTETASTGEFERTIEIKHNGDFNWKALLQYMHKLGGWGSSRNISCEDGDCEDGKSEGKPLNLGWDGDGADKIVSATINGQNVLGENAAILEQEIAADTSIRDHLTNKGWTQNKDKVWQHPTSKNQMVRTESTTHKHHYTVTHKSGLVTRHKTNSDQMLRNHISKLSQKPDNSYISNTLKEKQGSLHQYLGVSKGQTLPLGALEKLAKSNHPLADRAALVLRIKRKQKSGPVNFKANKE